MRLTPEQYAKLPDRMKPVNEQGRPTQRPPSYIANEERVGTMPTTTASMTLYLAGIPPSKKNSHIIIVNRATKRPMVIPKKEYRDWEKSAAACMRKQYDDMDGFTRLFPLTRMTPCLIQIWFAVKGARAWDLSNKAESIMDALVASGIVEDDNRFVVRELRISWLPSDEDHASITITSA